MSLPCYYTTREYREVEDWYRRGIGNLCRRQTDGDGPSPIWEGAADVSGLASADGWSIKERTREWIVGFALRRIYKCMLYTSLPYHGPRQSDNVLLQQGLSSRSSLCFSPARQGVCIISYAELPSLAVNQCACGELLEGLSLLFFGRRRIAVTKLRLSFLGECFAEFEVWMRGL